MKILLPDDYFIIASDRDYSLFHNETITGRDGEEKNVEKFIAYYGRLDKCVRRWIEHMANDDEEAYDIMTYVYGMEQLLKVMSQSIANNIQIVMEGEKDEVRSND